MFKRRVNKERNDKLWAGFYNFFSKLYKKLIPFKCFVPITQELGITHFFNDSKRINDQNGTLIEDIMKLFDISEDQAIEILEVFNFE